MDVQCVVTQMSSQTTTNSSDATDDTQSLSLPIGLSNLGNTCYQNSIIQCLFRNNAFVSRITRCAESRERERTTRDDNHSITTEFVELFRAFSTQTDPKSPLRAEGVRDAMARRHTTLGDGRQHDAQEFLALLLDALHEENHVTNESATKRLKKSECECDNQSAAREWNAYTARAGQSPVMDVFQGQLRSRLVCDFCKHESNTFEPFMYLALPLPLSHCKIDVTLIYIPLMGTPTRLRVTIENKYDSLVQLKSALRQCLALDARVLSNDDLLVTRISGNVVNHVFDDTDDVRAVVNGDNDCNDSRIYIFELNRIRGESRAKHDIEWRQCVICLEEKPIAELVSHARVCTEGCFCVTCLEAAEKHYCSGDSDVTFLCPSCQFPVSVNMFSECQTKDDNIFAIPLLFRSRDVIQKNNFILTHRVLMIRVTSPIDSAQIYALVDSRVPDPEHTYKLLFVERNGMTCCRCNWGTKGEEGEREGESEKVCAGCEVSRNGLITLCSNDTLCVAFETTSAVVDNSQSVVEDVSLSESTSINNSVFEPKLDLEKCLKAFIENECLTTTDDNQWFCAKCQNLRPAHKSLHVTRAPNTLIVYLKRFLFMSNRSRKLDQSVRFPIRQPLDMSPLLASNTDSHSSPHSSPHSYPHSYPHSDPHSSHSHNLYTLRAFVCHFGTISNGHYTCYVNNNNNQWIHCNDDKVSIESEDPDDSDSRAYIFFYSRSESTEGVGEGGEGGVGKGGLKD